MLYYLLFLFIAVGAKLWLALAMIYLLFPADQRCNNCDEETLLMQPSRASRWMAVLCLGTLQRRWCLACGWEGYARCAPRAAGARGRIGSPRAAPADDARRHFN
jgi:hypothetical protein